MIFGRKEGRKERKKALNCSRAAIFKQSYHLGLGSIPKIIMIPLEDKPSRLCSDMLIDTIVLQST